MTEILALDIATVCGFARGHIGGRPISGSVRFGKTGGTESAVFAHAMKWMAELLEPRPRPDILVLESMLPPGAKVGATNTNVRDRLAGLHGVVRAVAHLAGIRDIGCYSVGDIRAHFIGQRHFPREKAKREIMTRCALLGWDVPDDNAGDACAAWSFACSLIDPTQALKVSPLFNKRLQVRVV